ncbi:MAG: CYTH domain-containing protein, partial [Sinobacterium sp.]|nr:CYTH domain-containing protein [Sinobacterium sp.]
MALLEIERKFLVNTDAYKQLSISQYRITQGYLSSVPERTVRIRLTEREAFLTVKGAGNKSGMSRFEWEKNIPLEEGRSLLALCEPGVIDKTRYLVECEGLTYEVDEFYGDNLGLVVAELELESENQSFTRPNWLGDEVTGNRAYYNSMLMKKPFSTW